MPPRGRHCDENFHSECKVRSAYSYSFFRVCILVVFLVCVRNVTVQILLKDFLFFK